MQVVAVILLRLPATEALCAAGVSRGWRTAARTLTGLGLSFSITLHPNSSSHPQSRLRKISAGVDGSASAMGLWQMLRCAESPSAAQIAELV